MAFRSAVERARPDIIGFSIFSSSWPHSRRLIRAARRACPDAAIVAGGYHPTFRPEQTLRRSSVDVVCVGEGEEAMCDFAESIERNAIHGSANPSDAARELQFFFPTAAMV